LEHVFLRSEVQTQSSVWTKRERERFTYVEKETLEDWERGEHEESGHMLLVFIVPVETWLWGGQQQLQLF